MLESQITSPVARDFDAAIDRLIAGKPNNPKLKQMAARGKLKLNFSTVALESGRSRTLIALPTKEELDDIPPDQRPKTTCAYPEIRRRILQLTEPKSRSSGPRTELATLRAANKDLEAKLKNALDQARERLTAFQAAERDRDRWRESYKRLFAQSKKGNPCEVVSFIHPKE